MSLFRVDKIGDAGFGVHFGVHNGSQSLWKRQMAGGYSEYFLKGECSKSNSQVFERLGFPMLITTELHYQRTTKESLYIP